MAMEGNIFWIKMILEGNFLNKFLEARLQHPDAPSGGNFVTCFPKFVLAYLVHSLAHHSKFPALTGYLL